MEIPSAGVWCEARFEADSPWIVQGQSMERADCPWTVREHYA